MHWKKNNLKFILTEILMKINKYTFLILFVAICFNNAQSQTGVVVDKIIAVVGSKVILQSDLENQYLQYINQGYDVKEDMRCFVFEELLYQTLLTNQAELDSVKITDAQVESELQRRLRYFINQIGSEKKLEEYYKKSIAEIKNEFRELVKEQLIVQSMQAKITEGIKISPAEVKEFYNSIPSDSLPLVSSEVEVAQIVSYATVPRELKELALEKINSLRERILKGENFSTLAVLYSEDPVSAKKGGELGYVSKADLVPEFSAAAFKLKGNEVSEVVESEYGYHIIQLIDRKGNQINVRHILVKPGTSPDEILNAKERLVKVREDILTHDTLTFTLAAQLYSDDKTTKNNGGIIINPASSTPQFEIEQLEPSVFFVIDKMKAGEISQPVPFQTPDGRDGYRLLLLKIRTEPHRANLKEDYARIQNFALSEKQNKIINKWIADKIKVTHINVNKDYSHCEFTNPWTIEPAK
jgi:peptidyl-prolyl cis-trans isomerase SurA